METCRMLLGKQNVEVYSVDEAFLDLKEFAGKGLISEAIQLIETECFRLGFHRIEIRCSSRNEKSAMVALRNKYILEGYLKDEIIENGEFRDTFIFAKRAADLNKEQKS